MKWHFSPQPNDQVETEITQRDQFNNDDVDISETIVREAIQNSLDAGVDDPCRVKVTFSWVDQNDGLSKSFFKNLFDCQTKHALAAGLEVDSVDFENPTALVIEDFGTCGLTGSVNKWDNNNFCDFWRRHGKSHKTGKSRGRWGLGKLVYSQASQVGVFFGVTRRNPDNEIYLMGQTVLNLHTVDGIRYPPHAFFADVENEEDVGLRMTVPLKDQELVGQFASNFSLKRLDNPGLSVIIPFPNEAFNLAKMIEVAIGNYFYPLITGQLVLVFDDIEITAANVRELAKQYASNRFHQVDILFDFIEDAYRAEQADRLELKPSWMDDRKLDEDDFDAETLEEIRDRFAKGELVGLYLPVVVKPKNSPDKPTGFSVYIKRPAELTRGFDLYVRGGLTLPKEAKFGDRRALGAMIAEEETICAFLGDAENAAHTIWTTNTEKLRKNYRSSQALATVIKKSVIQLYDLLAEVTEEVDEDALQNFFWFEEPEEGKRKRKRKKPKKPDPIPAIDRAKPLIHLNKVEGGFTLTNTDDFTDDKLPHEVKVEIAYEVAKGNAFKKYNPLDFKLGGRSEIKCTANTDNVEVISSKHNIMELEIKKLPFRLSVRGFDSNRDLKINVRQR
jgi:hypothetical protein